MRDDPYTPPQKKPFRHGWSLLVLFLAYFTLNAASALQHAFHSVQFEGLLTWGLTLFVFPFLTAAVAASVRDGCTETRGGLRTYAAQGLVLYGRFVAIELVLFATAVAAFTVARAFGVTLEAGNWRFLALMTPITALRVTWQATVAVERGRYWRSLARSLRLLLCRPLALGVAFAVAATGLADTLGDQESHRAAIQAMTGVRALLMAATKLAGLVALVALYRKARVSVFHEAHEIAPPPPPELDPGSDLLKPAAAFTLLSFIPGLHVVALLVGTAAMRRCRRFHLRALVACCSGGFFTLLYIIVLVGTLAGRAQPREAPGLGFLAEADPSLQHAVEVLQTPMYESVAVELRERAAAGDAGWPVLCAAAIADAADSDYGGAYAKLKRATELDPPDARFHYTRGRILMEAEDLAAATDGFNRALEIDPDMAGAGRYLALLTNRFEPTPLVSGIASIIIIFFLLTAHEYAHAYTAWRLGDNTAKDAGRLTWNPIAHVDLVGSILLPGILIWRQAGVVFGWAKPVPINRENFANPRQDDIKVSFAGPGTNLAIGMICVLLLITIATVVRIAWPEAIAMDLAAPYTPLAIAGTPIDGVLCTVLFFIKQTLFTTITLGCFNLIPVPPLDGSWILSGLLPGKAAAFIDKVRPYSFVLFLAIVMTPALDYLLVVPFTATWLVMQACLGALGLA